jgi:hypothetical protein
MIGSSVELAVGFINGVPSHIDFGGSYYFSSVDELSGGRNLVGNCLLWFRCEMDCWNASDLVRRQLDDVRNFTRFYVICNKTPFVKFDEFMIISLRVGLEEELEEEEKLEELEEKVVESSLFYLVLKKLELFRVCGYYRLLVGVSKRGGKRGDWK